MENGPARSFVLVSLVVIMLLLLHLYNPIIVNGVTLRQVSILSDLSKNKSNDDQVEENLKAFVPKPKGRNNTFKETNPHGVVCIEDYSEDCDGGMNNFYNALDHINKMDRPVRIAYYGDSFIEGDILSGDLRQLLQSKYGGSGVGWVDCSSLSSGFRKTVYEKSGGWLTHSITDHGFKRGLQGINERYFLAKGKSFTTLTCSKNRAHSVTCDHSDVYYYTNKPFELKASVNGEQSKPFKVYTGRIASSNVSGKIHSVMWNIDKTDKSSRFFGITMESNKGVILDNLSMRGTPGIALTSIPATTLKSFADLRPYDLIIIHFGLNATTNNILSSAYYKLYQHRMEKVIQHFKVAYPHTSILIVSISDKCSRDANGIHTAKGVQVLSSYQQLIAYNTHVAYFNLLKAMKIKGGMKLMVEKKQANLDYTHINFKGGKIISKYFFDAFIAGKNNYERKKLYK